MPRDFGSYFLANGFHHRLFLADYFYRSADVDLALKPYTVVHDDSAAGNITRDIAVLGETDHAFTVDVTDDLPQYDNGDRMNVGLDPALLAYR